MDFQINQFQGLEKMATSNAFLSLKKFKAPTIILSLLLIVSFLIFSVNLSPGAWVSVSFISRNLAEPKLYTVYYPDRPISWTVPSDAFSESVTIVRADIQGKPLPKWLEFVAADGSFVIHPRISNSDDLLIDLLGRTASSTEISTQIILRTRNRRPVLPIASEEALLSTQQSVMEFSIIDTTSGAFLLWSHNEPGNTNGRIYGGSVTDSCGLSKTQYLISAQDSKTRRNPGLTKFNNGNILLTWVESPTSSSGLAIQVLSSSLSVVTATTVLSSSYVFRRLFTHVPLDNGNIMIIGETTNNELLGIIVDNTGDIVTSEIELDSSTIHVNVKILKLSTGDIMISWNNGDDTHRTPDLFFIVVSQSGTSVRAFNVLGDTVFYKLPNQMIQLSGGPVANVWSDGHNLWLNLYDTSSGYVCSHYEVFTDDNNMISSPSFVAFDSSTVLISWIVAPDQAPDQSQHVKKDPPETNLHWKILQLSVLSCPSSSTPTTATLVAEGKFRIARPALQSPFLKVFTTNRVLIAWGANSTNILDGANFVIIDNTGKEIVPPQRINGKLMEGSSSTPVPLIFSNNNLFFAWTDSKEVPVLKYRCFGNTPIDNYVPEIKSLAKRSAKSNKEFNLDISFIDYDDDALKYFVIVPEGDNNIPKLEVDQTEGTARGKLHRNEYTFKFVAFDKYQTGTPADVVIDVKGSFPWCILLICVGSISIVVALVYWIIRVRRLRKMTNRRRGFSDVVLEIPEQLPEVSEPPSSQKKSLLLIDLKNIEVSLGLIPDDLAKIKKLPSKRGRQDDFEEERLVTKPVYIPDSFLCPITRELMSDPVLVVSGTEKLEHTYERTTILEWFMNNKLDPLTRKEVKKLVFNQNLREKIEDFVSKLSREQLKNDGNLRAEIDSWIKRRGTNNVLNDKRLVSLVINLEEARPRKVKKEPTKIQLSDDDLGN